MERTPIRVQRRRVKGEPGMPAGAKYVGRPSRWGNPFSVYIGRHGGASVFGPDWSTVRSWPIGAGIRGMKAPEVTAASIYSSHSHVEDAYRHAVELFETLCAVRRRDQPDEFAAWLAPLRGCDLACWCPVDSPWCHGVPLLALANEEVR